MMSSRSGAGITREDLLAQFLDYDEGAKACRYPPKVGIRGLEGAARLLGHLERRGSVSTELKVFTSRFDRDLEGERERERERE